MNKLRRPTLRLIISSLVISSVLLAIIVSIAAARQVNKSSLIDSHLHSNLQYAKKLALNTSDLLESMKNDMALAAEMGKGDNPQKTLDSFYETHKQYFNSVFIVDETNVVKALSPEVENIEVGVHLTSQPTLDAIAQKKTLISKPYVGVIGKLILLISSPIFDENGDYKGFAAGTIYLEEDNVLNRLLKDHFFGNGSYVFVVDSEGNLIFHPEKKRMGQSVIENEVVKKVLNKKTGYQKVTNTLGRQFYAGYAYEKNTGWGIISQTPVAIIDQPLEDLDLLMIKRALPFIILIILVSWLVSTKISRPLHELAEYSESSVNHLGKTRTKLPPNRSITYEENQLYKSLKIAFSHIDSHISQLNNEVMTDGLTGIANRRTFDNVINEWIEKRIPFSLIMLDIDHFKLVNDNHGHQLGDEVLKYLAGNMVQLLREGDLCFRYGGEEFGILVKTGDLKIVRNIGERLRQKMERTPCPIGKPVTISLGIACFPAHGTTSSELIQKADKALYQSKMSGRNTISICS